ncbi:MAG: hypothetical protein KKA73_05090 [Chloroflexi bacterium]|nr:hypothetical protein [Chloroflexota bacterium]MBU1747043.1 hypothetical protein [Chloroflexota bacterium]
MPGGRLLVMLDGLDERWREWARKDPDFDVLRPDVRFKVLMGHDTD